MKKLILLSLLLVTAIFVNAQRPGGNPEARAQKKVDHLTEQLGLSVDQQAEIKEILISQPKNQKVNGKKRSELSQEEREVLKAERKANKTAIDNQIAAVLTPEQNELYQNLAKEGKGGQKANKGKKGKGKKGKKGNKGKATPEEKAQRKVDKLTEQLGLDEAQQADVAALLAKQTPKVKGQEVKDLSKEKRAALRAERKADKAAYEAELATILAAEQLETYQNLPKPERKKKKGKKKNKK